MLKNIPNKYTRYMLLDLINIEGRYKRKINFLYMPIDFNTECNVGYCFLNFRKEADAEQFIREFNGVHKSA